MKIPDLIKHILYTVLFVLILFGCSTEKNAFLNRGYHYTTTRFNGYFHGREALKLAQANIYTNHKDDYEDILNIYRYGDTPTNQNEYSNLNRAINKAAKMIDRHSMQFKINKQKVEVNHMIDDCYQLMGVARFFKQEFDDAEKTFLFIIQQFENEPIKFDAQIWLIKNYIYQKNYVDASTEIQKITEENKLPKKLLDDFLIVQAYYFIETENYPKAIEMLEKAIKIVKKRKLRNRLKYILGQLYQKQNDLKKASVMYTEVAKKAANYELQFNAKISLAKTFETKQNSDYIISLLEKMLSDDKNKEYKDQIYFAIAEVYEKANKKALAIENYKNAAKYSVNNPKQKGKAYLALGNYYFEESSFKNAKLFYDSALVALPKEYKSYSTIETKSNSLKDLVYHLDVVEREDSLQKIVNMSEADRKAFIADQIQKVIEKEEKEIALNEAKLAEMQAKALLNNSNSAWIFDNPVALAGGYAEFKNIWGDRPLEENWRRSDKTTVSNFDNNSNEELLTDQSIDPEKTEEFYLKDLPFDEQAMKLSNDKIKESLYELGIIYRDNFQNLKQSNYYFEMLNKRYPKNEKELISWYQLYRNYDKLSNQDKMNFYKTEILSKYPTSIYAELLEDPNVLASKEKEKAQTNSNYESAFKLFKNNNFQESIEASKQYMKANPDNHLAGKFDMLIAFSKGNLFGPDTLANYLQEVYTNYQGTEVSNEAYLILSRINQNDNANKKAQQAEIEKEKAFILDKNEPHYFCVIVNTEIVNAEELKSKIADLNNNFFGPDMLEVQSIVWEKNEEIIIVKKITNPNTLKSYHQAVKEQVLKDFKAGDLHFIISKTNYSKLFKYKDTLEYSKFYTINYIEK